MTAWVNNCFDVTHCGSLLESAGGVSWRRPRLLRGTVLRRRKVGSVVMSVEDGVGDGMPDVLRSIIERKWKEVDALKEEVKRVGEDEHPVGRRLRDGAERKKRFWKALNTKPGNLAVIAEIKRKSPSKGYIGRVSDPGTLSRAYRDGGAAVVSVLTDFEGFGGTLDDLKDVVKTQESFKGQFPGPCPVIRKDFTVDEIQIAEAAEAGASAILLIVAALGNRTKELLDATHRMGLDALVEVHDEDELKIALDAGAEIVGVNNRNLRTFEVSLETSERLRDRIPEGLVCVAESGIKDPLDAWKIRDMNYNAILVGESLVQAAEETGVGMVSSMYQPGFNMAQGLIRAYRSKGSIAFGNPTTAMFSGKGEGAKETLGEISI